MKKRSRHRPEFEYVPTGISGSGDAQSSKITALQFLNFLKITFSNN